MGKTITARPLTGASFAPFGEVVSADGAPDWLINAGRCGRYNDRAAIDIAEEGRAGISVFQSENVALPYRFDLVERHPLGSQAFLPLHGDPFLVIVAPDLDGTPDAPLAFVTDGAQGVNIARNVWHGVLAPLGCGLFAVVDRIGDGPNLQEHRYAAAFSVTKG